MTSVGRRTVLVALGGALLGGCRTPQVDAPPPAPEPTAARSTAAPAPPEGGVRADSWQSAAARRRVTATVSVPAGTAPRRPHPVIVLHGLGGDHTSALRAGLLDAQRRMIAAGARPFAVVTVDGGSYYHPRVGGEDYGAMVLHELLGRLEPLCDTTRVGFAGFSMGGYGALLLGSMLGPGRCPAVAAASPAVWVPGDSPAPGAFDGSRDHRTWSLFNRRTEVARIPCRIEASTSDPFRAADRRLAEALRRTGGSVQASFDRPGEHSDRWWGEVLPEQLRFCADRL